MKRLVAGASLGVGAFLLLGFGMKTVRGQDNPGTAEYYQTKVKPILESNCYRCHGGLNRRGGLNLETREAMFKGGHDGTVLVPGDPAKSLLVRLIRHEGPANDPMPMPPKKPKLSDADIAIVEQWVKAGAIM
jgi:cytochrome c